MLKGYAWVKHVRGNPVRNPCEILTNISLNHPSRCFASLEKDSVILDCGKTTIPTAMESMKIFSIEIAILIKF